MTDVRQILKPRPTSTPAPQDVFVDSTLVTWLDRHFPDVCPPSNTSREEFLVYAAKVEFANSLRHLSNRSH